MSNEVGQDLTPAQVEVAFQRTLKVLSIPYSLRSDGSAVPEHDLHELQMSMEFRDEFSRQLKLLVVNQTVEELIRKGLIEKVWIDEKNDYGYRILDETIS